MPAARQFHFSKEPVCLIYMHLWGHLTSKLFFCHEGNGRHGSYLLFQADKIGAMKNKQTFFITFYLLSLPPQEMVQKKLAVPKAKQRFPGQGFLLITTENTIIKIEN